MRTLIAIFTALCCAGCGMHHSDSQSTSAKLPKAVSFGSPVHTWSGTAAAGETVDMATDAAGNLRITVVAHLTPASGVAYDESDTFTWAGTHGAGSYELAGQENDTYTGAPATLTSVNYGGGFLTIRNDGTFTFDFSAGGKRLNGSILQLTVRAPVTYTGNQLSFSG